MGLKVEYRESHLNLIAGDWGKPGYHLTFEDPWGNHWQSMSGEKPEYGPGGFECGVHPPGAPYTVKAGVLGWAFEHKEGMTFLTLTEEPEPPEPPGPEPPEPPGPEPEPGKILVQPGRIYSAVLEDGTIAWYEGERDDAIWVYIGHYLPGTNLWLSEREPALPLLAAWTAELRLRAERLETHLLKRL
jgi:hypothetical protein